ncbi:hypothetical protein [Lacrimispora indolis]|uniref:hypothetical protein n=1 Tax=Lacrimispora indolis TaxID=69825 RepID=UPI00041AD19A|nr:hypothetical protein [[Clostridium] methoxybenzovorans]
MGYTRTITEKDLENAMWHFNNNMAAKMEADRLQYRDARAVIAYLLELRDKQEVIKTDIHSQTCPRCGKPVNQSHCGNCGQALKY